MSDNNNKIVRFDIPSQEKISNNIFSCKLLLSFYNNNYFGQDIINPENQFNKLDDALQWVCTTLAKHFSKLDIDFPQDYDEFQLLWFKSQYFKGDVFTYFLHNGNKFIEPWDRQDIYEIVLDFMQKIDEEYNVSDKEIETEINEEELLKQEQNEEEEIDEETKKLENIIRDIISKS